MNEVTTTYLEMTSPTGLKARQDPQGITIRECVIKQFQFNRFLYQLIGGPWGWKNKLSWPDDQWKAYAQADDLRMWAAYVEGSPAGYYELQKQHDGNVEIVYFGLAPRFIGLGYGGYFLSHAIRSAWNWEGTRRLWVHTCSLDHPAALQNYKARGMKVYHETINKTP